MKRTAVTDLAEYCAGLEPAALDRAVTERTRELILDFLGVVIAGAGAESSRAVASVAARSRDPEGASGVGIPTRLTPGAAAMLNGAAGHARELDDVVRESSLHPGVTVIPAALATAEAENADGAGFITSVIAGYEVAIRVGNALNPKSAYARGFHPTGVAGVFGAAAAAARGKGADTVTIANALGIAGTMASGSMEYLTDGSWTKRLTAGWAAHGGVVAAELAVAGFTGPATALDGPFGVLHSHTDDPSPVRLTDALGGTPQLMSVAIKPYASCRYNHALVDGALELRRRHEIVPSSIRRITLGVLSAGMPLVGQPIDQKRRPQNIVDAQFSAPFAVAAAFVYGAAGESEYREQNLADPLIQTLMLRTDAETDPSLDAVYPRTWPATVEVELDDGSVHSTRIDHARGEPENPLDRNAVRAKFRECVAATLSEHETDRLESAVLTLGGREPVGLLGDLLRSVFASSQA